MEYIFWVHLFLKVRMLCDGAQLETSIWKYLKVLFYIIILTLDEIPDTSHLFSRDKRSAVQTEGCSPIARPREMQRSFNATAFSKMPYVHHFPSLPHLGKTTQLHLQGIILAPPPNRVPILKQHPRNRNQSNSDESQQTRRPIYA